MSRLKRLHVPGGVYYVVVRGNGGERIFEEGADYEAFSALVSQSLRRNRCHMHAFCWLDNRILMAAQIADVRIGRFVQHVTAQYAKYLHGKQKRTGHLFAQHHRALLVQRSRYLLDLIRYIHLAPVREGQVSDASDYAWSGDRAYRGHERIAWLTTHVAHDMLAHAGHRGAIGYRDWIARGDDPEIAKLFEAGMKHEPRAVGDDGFIAQVAGFRDLPRPEGALDDLIANVARSQGVSLRSVLSSSRRHPHVLARAMITWQATQRGLATLTEIAARLHRDPSTLWTAVERYRAVHPELFPEPAEDEWDSQAAEP